MHILNEVFDYNITLLASFLLLLTTQAATSQQDYFFVIFVHFMKVALFRVNVVVRGSRMLLCCPNNVV